MKKNTLLILSLIFLALFILITLSFNTLTVNQIDSSLNLFSATHQTGFLQNLSKILSTIFEPTYIIIFVLALSIFLWIYKKKKQATILALTSLVGGIFIYAIKHLVTRARPTNALIADSGFSFPSGHALISTVLFGILIYFSLKLKSGAKKTISLIACILGVLIVGLSRVYLNIHWLSDIVAGYCFGLFLVFGALFLCSYLKIKN